MELLSIQVARAENTANKQIAEVKRKAAEALADAAAARQDLEEEQRQRKAAQEALQEEKHSCKLLEELNRKADTLLERSEGVPVLVHNAQVAMDEPLQMAREIREIASSELSRDALALFYELENGLSVNAASKKLGVPRQTLDRRLHDEIEPFRKRHNLPVPGKGKHRIIPFPPNK